MVEGELAWAAAEVTDASVMVVGAGWEGAVGVACVAKGAATAAVAREVREVDWAATAALLRCERHRASLRHTGGSAA